VLFLNTLSRRIWTILRNDMVTKPRLDVQNKIFMFTITWNPSGFYVVNRLPNAMKINSDCFVTNMFIPLEQTIFPRGSVPHQKWLVIHIDNCSVHTNRASTDYLEKYSICRMSYQSYLSDLASSDFYLFLTIENSNRFRWLTRTSFLTACKRF
jgi:hypothetical protein